MFLKLAALANMICLPVEIGTNHGAADTLSAEIVG